MWSVCEEEEVGNAEDMSKKDSRPNIVTDNLHPFFKKGTCGVKESSERKLLYLSSLFDIDHSFSDYPDTHYLNGPDYWQQLREKIIMSKKLGVQSYEGVLGDMGELLDDILILCLHEKRQYCFLVADGCKTDRPSTTKFHWNAGYTPNIKYKKDE